MRLALMMLPFALADRFDEDCEACGLLAWRMQTIVAQKQSQLEHLKQAKEKRAKQAKKAHSKRWLRNEYSAELAAAVEEQIDGLSNDQRIIGGACRMEHEAVDGSALRGSRFDNRCRSRVTKRLEDVLSTLQDDLASAVVAGKGAAVACPALLDGCSASRATLLLGSGYKDGLSWAELDHLQIGFSDHWAMHHDVDGSAYWFSKAK